MKKEIWTKRIALVALSGIIGITLKCRSKEKETKEKINYHYKIKAIKKWDSNSHEWRKLNSSKERGTALSSVSYNVKNDENNFFNYLVIADGCKVNDFSHDGKTMDIRKNGIINVLNYLKNKQENFIVESIYMDIDSPHIEESKWIASHINKLATNPNIKTISFIGGSKCGNMALDMIKYLSNESLSKSLVYSLSSVYTGALLASPILLNLEFKRIIEGKLGQNVISEKIVSILSKVHYNNFSKSQLDFDISIPGGVPLEFMKQYDPTYLQNMFSKENIEAVERVAHWQNICTQIDSQTLKEVIKAKDLYGLGFCVLNKFLFDKKSDGLVSIESQKAVEQFFTDEHANSITIHSSHFVLKVPRYINELLDIVTENLENENLMVRKRG